MATLTCDGETINLELSNTNTCFRSILYDDAGVGKTESAKKVMQYLVKVDDAEPPISFPNNTFNYFFPERGPAESFTDYWARISALGECSFCGESGHQAKKCPSLKNNQCVLCGFCGHTPKKCNKAARAPDGKRVGRCTFCKGDDKWGHWLVTCKAREERYGPFQFPDGVDTEKALAPLYVKNK